MDAAVDIGVYVAQRLRGEVMRPPDEEIGAKRYDLLTARDIGRSENRQRRIRLCVGGRLRTIGGDGADDAILQPKVDEQLCRTGIGDEYALRRMGEEERRRSPVAVRRGAGNTVRGGDLSRACAAPIGCCERENEDAAGNQGQETQHTREAAERPAPFLRPTHSVCSVR